MSKHTGKTAITSNVHLTTQAAVFQTQIFVVALILPKNPSIMDLFRKLLRVKEEEGSEKNNSPSAEKVPPFDDFKKPTWLNEEDSDDELFDNKTFGLQIFASPKEFQQQMQELMKQFEGEDVVKFFEQNRASLISDFQMHEELKDEEIKAEDFKQMLDKGSPLMSSSPRLQLKKIKTPQTDEEQIMERIHGTVEEPEPSIRGRVFGNLPPGHPKIEVAPFTGPGGKMFTQSIITTTVRKPDGVRKSCYSILTETNQV